MLGPVAIPMRDNYIMFDLEGMPPHLDELEKIYLWGMQVYGKRLITSKKPTSTSTSTDMAIPASCHQERDRPPTAEESCRVIRWI